MSRFAGSLSDVRQPGATQAGAGHRTAAAPVHLVRCTYCAIQFDLFAATWCAHRSGRPSKICPHCRRCLCEHPAYAEPRFWKEAPRGFQKQGFRQLFLYYV